LGAALAARVLRDEGHHVVFVNHADHVFGFGHGAADVVAEVSGFGWKLTAERRTARAQHFLGIPVPPPPAPVPADETQRAIVTGPVLSIGAGRKYRPDNEVSFPAFLMALMVRTDRPVELVGPNSKEPWWQPVKARFGSRLRLRGRLSFEQTRERLASAACYVDSFPVTGGTALTQGLMAGKAVFAPPFSAGGYSLADVLRSASVAAMTDEIIKFLETGEEPASQALVRKRIENEFGKEGISNRIILLETGSFKPPPEELLADGLDLRYHVDAWYRSGEPTFSWPPQAKPGLLTRVVLCVHMLKSARFRRPKLQKVLRWGLIGPRIN